MATIREVAKRADVAPMTVSRVINRPETVAEATRERVQRAIRDLNYVPNRLGLGLRNKQTMAIALVVGDISNPFATEQILGVSEAAKSQGYNLIFAHTDSSPEEELAQLRHLVERRVDGIVLSPVLNTPDAVRFVQEQGVPIVVLDYPMPDNDVDVVRSDSEDGAHRLTQYLINLGHTRIAMLSGTEQAVTARERAAGYRAAMQAAGLSEDIRFGAFSIASGYAMAGDVLTAKERPTALVTASNFIGLGAARRARDLGLRIPEDVSVVTFDNIGTEIAFDPFFTGMVQPVRELAALATDMLLERATERHEGPGRDVVRLMELDTHSSAAGPHPG